MTTTNNKLRSVLLSAMLVMSVFAGTVAFAGTAAANTQMQDGDVVLGDNNRYWQGQTLFYDNSSIANADKIELVEKLGDSPDDFEREISPDSEGDVRVKTGSLDGSYALQHTNGTDIVRFDVAAQDLSASFEDDSVDNVFNSETTLTLDSARSDYNATATADDLSASDLEKIFDTNNNVNNDAFNTTTEDGVKFNNIQSDTLDANFSDIDAGNYTIEFEVIDTGATAEANISVTEGGDATANLASDGVISEERGDNATFTVDLTNTQTATGSIGGDSVNWKANFTLNDNNEDGHVNVTFNTYATAGADEPEAFLDAEGEDTVTSPGNHSVYSGSNFGAAGSGEGIDNPIAAGSSGSGTYEMTTGVSNNTQDVTQLVLSEGSVDSATAWTHPEASSLPDEASGLLEGAVDDDSTAMDDLAVVQVEASGLYGNLTSYTQLDNVTNDPYALNFTQTNAGANAEGNTFNGSDLSSNAVYFDGENNTFYAVVDTADHNIESGHDYEAEFKLDESSPLTDETQTASTNFSVEERTLEFTNLNESDLLEVEAGETNITGETSIAAGSEFTVQVQSDQFVQTATATVDENGEFTAPFDFSDVETGTDLTVTASSNDASDEVDGVIVENVVEETTTESDNETETTTTTTETTTTEETSTEETTETTEDTTETTTSSDGSIPGFGVTLSLVALVAAALLALRRSN